MHRKFLSGLSIMVLLNLLIKPTYIFIIDPKVQNLVGANEFGIFFFLFSFSWILNIFLDFGTTNFNNREVARHPQLLDKLFSNLFGIRIILGLSYIAICILFALFRNYDSFHIKLLLLLAINQVIASFNLYLRSNVNGLHFFKTDSILSVLDRFILIILCSVLIWSNIFNHEFKIQWYVYCQTISYAITFLVAILVLLPKLKTFKIQFDIIYFRSLIQQSFPFALLAFLMSTYKYFDGFALGELLPQDGALQAGVYAQSFRLFDGMSQFAFLFATILLPVFSRMLKKKQAITHIVSLSSTLLIIPACILTVNVIIFKYSVINFFFEHTLNISEYILALHMLSFVAICITYIYGTLLTANGNLKELQIMAACAVAISITLNILLIPKYKALGAAIAQLSAQMFMSVTQVIYAQKKLKPGINFKRLISIAGFIILASFIGKNLQHFVNSWHVAFLISIATSIILMFALRILNLKMIRQFINTKDSNAVE